MVPRFTFTLDVEQPTTIRFELRVCSRLCNYTPDVSLATEEVPLSAAKNQTVDVHFAHRLDDAQYAFVCLMTNPNVLVHTSRQRLSGLLGITNSHEKKVANSGTQQPPEDIGVDTFELWRPLRRPQGQNLALRIDPPLETHVAGNLVNGFARPTTQPNAWAASFDDPAPNVVIGWPEPQRIGRIELCFDTDFDHPMESVLMGHPENVMPFCVRNYRLYDDQKRLVQKVVDNYQTRNTIRLSPLVETSTLCIDMDHPSRDVPAALFAVRCYVE